MAESDKSLGYVRGLLTGLMVSAATLVAAVLVLSIAFVANYGWSAFFLVPGNESPWPWFSKVMGVLVLTFLAQFLVYLALVRRS